MTEITPRMIAKAKATNVSRHWFNGKAVAFDDYYDCDLDHGEITIYDEHGKELAQKDYSQRDMTGWIAYAIMELYNLVDYTLPNKENNTHD